MGIGGRVLGIVNRPKIQLSPVFVSLIPQEAPVAKRAAANPVRASRAETLRADFEVLGRLLVEAEGSAAAALARERRIIGELLERLEADVGEVPFVDQLAARRRTGAGAPRAASRRRQSG